MNDEPKYACWAEHAEDLTEAVDLARKNPGELQLRYEAARDRESAPKKLIVECSEGHLNTFDL